MEDDEDEIVVFDHTPLYEHLKSTGIDGLSFEHVTRKYQQHNTIRSEPSSWFSVFVSIKEKVSSVISTIFGIVRVEGFRTIYLDNYFNNTARRLLRNEKLLDEEDQEFLENYLGSQPSLITSDLEDSSKRSYWWSFASVPLLIAAIYKQFTLQSDGSVVWTSFTVNCLLLSSGLHVLYSICKSIHCFRRKCDVQQCLRTIQNFVSESECLLLNIKKALRLIQEYELISRGFTLVSSKTPLSLFEQNRSQRQCPELRRLVFSTCRHLLTLFRNTTLTLVKKFPFDKNVDKATNYLSLMSLEEYGLCLDKEILDEEGEKQLYSLTDGYTIVVLKGITHLFILHQSELVRRLVLCFHPQTMSADFMSLKEIVTLINSLNSVVKDQSKELQTLVNYHKSCVLKPSSNKPRRIFATDAVEDFYTAVHSLELHLQATLKRVNCFASTLEENFSGEKHEDITSSEENSSWELTLNEIKSSLRTCMDCLDESTSRMQSLLKKPHKGYQSKTETNMSSLSISLDSHVHVVGAEDPVFEDQVFEAYTEHEETSTDSLYEENFFTPEQKALRKKQREHEMRLLTELKSIISLRGKEREEKEEKILAEQRSKDNGTVTSNEHRSLHLPENANKIEKSDLLQPSVGAETENSRNNARFQDIEPDCITRTESDKEELNKRFSDLQSNISMCFVADVAARAAAKSKAVSLCEETFGDDDDDDDDDDDVSLCEETFGDDDDDIADDVSNGITNGANYSVDPNR